MLINKSIQMQNSSNGERCSIQSRSSTSRLGLATAEIDLEINNANQSRIKDSNHTNCVIR